MEIRNRPANRTGTEQDGVPVPQRYFAYAAIIIGIFLAVVDATVANVALPTIAADFRITAAGSVEIVSAYQLTIVMLLLPMASLGDIYGYHRVYIYGLSIFTFASAVCAFSNSFEALTAARILQGVGAAGIMSVNAALIRVIFPQNRLGQVIGVNAMVVAVAATIGPSFASIVLAVASWKWLFAINVPVGMVALLIAARVLPRSRYTGQLFDWFSAFLTAAMFGLLVAAIDSYSHRANWAAVAAQIAAGVTAGIWAVLRQRQRKAPLLPIDLLRVPIFSLSICTSICSFAAQALAFVALPFFMEEELGLKAASIGFLMMPWPLAVALVAPLAGRMADRHSASILGFVGLLTLSGGLVLLAFLPMHPGGLNVGWRMAVCGCGFGLFQSPNNRTMIASAPRSRSGAVGGMLATGRLLGQATGATLVGLDLSRSPLHGSYFALLLGAGIAVFAAIISGLRGFGGGTVSITRL